MSLITSVVNGGWHQGHNKSLIPFHDWKNRVIMSLAASVYKRTLKNPYKPR